MDNVVSIFTKQEPCKYLSADSGMFIKSYMNDMLHSFNCHDCQRRYAIYMKSSIPKVAGSMISASGVLDET